ncbi:hypothetical protein MT997_23315 [Paenibacillus sp. OVF10]|nr:hypothetical protein MT997_23315 [Paenibacillus sp. OVF10]
MHADRFLGGQMRLYPELAERTLGNLGEKLGLNAEQTAQAILDVATANMYAQFSPSWLARVLIPAILRCSHMVELVRCMLF